MDSNLGFYLICIIIIQCYSGSDAVTYYVSPGAIGNGICTVNGNTILRPCYSLQQLRSHRSLLSDKSLVNLYLLPGVHEIPNVSNIGAFNVGKLEIRPWNEQENVTIECQKDAGFYLVDIRKLKIISVNFVSCGIDLKNG